MDEIAEYNKKRWKALANADALFTQAKFDLDIVSAKELIDPHDRFGDVTGKQVLCLAGGGGQQSAAFALLGAKVTAFDISAEQLEHDRKVAGHYDVGIKTVEGDMRDLAEFEKDSFDIVHHPYSINFVPDTGEVFREVSRVLKKGGLYQVSFANPFVMGIKQDNWNGEGYILKEPYLSGAEISYPDQVWVYDQSENKPIPQPKEYRHYLSDVMNNLIENGFIIRFVSDNDSMNPDSNAEPASWDHFVSFAPPWLSIFAFYQPDLKF
jgi:ubiquinone/menaquinone biosynthesis C-methylase UbiE